MKFKLILTLLICLILMQISNSIIKNGQQRLRSFQLFGKKADIPVKIFAAEIHYSRIPNQYWQHRLLMVKAMGFNAISVYVMWNFHQIEKGKFDYLNGDKNLKGFLSLAHKLDFYVLFRPGPYVCAQWDFGGLPARLMSIKDLEIRANNKAFLDQVKVYFASLVPLLFEFSKANAGPIILLQIQNEYGFYGNDKTYIQALRDIWEQYNISNPQYYVDIIQNLQKSHWPGANIGINNGVVQQSWVKARKLQPDGYIFGGQIYSGWLTHWGQKWQGKSIQNYTKQFTFLMTYNHSFSMYMAHGGSNFGLWAGANAAKNKSFDYLAHITSYDYDAPINEQGSPNQKYHIFRELAKNHATWNIPQIPASIKTIEIKDFTLSAFADIMMNLPSPTLLDVNELVVFEDQRLKMWNQGFVLYQTKIASGSYNISLNVHDFALVFVNGQYFKTLNRSEITHHNIKLQVGTLVNKLQILVESMGHINFGNQMKSDYKGIIEFKADFKPHRNSKGQQSRKLIHQTRLLHANDFAWNITKIPIDQNLLKMNKKSINQSFPRMFRYNLTLSQVGDTYLNMENWQKGYIFVNSHNLGRYWNKGPQQKLFLPGVWLKKDVNDIVVLDLLMSKARFIKGDHNLQIEGQFAENIIQNEYISQIKTQNILYE